MPPARLFVAIISMFSMCVAYPLRLETSLWRMTDVIGYIVWSITGEEYGTSGMGLLYDGMRDEQGWYDPRLLGGQMLDFTTETLGEPLNIIISGQSDPFVLTDPGFHYYTKSLGFAQECMGLHYGNIHRADLGDGQGPTDELYLARQHYFPVWGTCWESLAGGYHFRAWKQNGTLADSGAWFLGASKEEDSSKNHKIVDDGYNIGRDWIVERAVRGTYYKSKWWRAEVEWNEDDLLKPGSEGVNHGIAQDGRVAILTVHRA